MPVGVLVGVVLGVAYWDTGLVLGAAGPLVYWAAGSGECYLADGT